tara:strand:- start:13201 stop:14349 length:1149 start_codon:yes stop_codon:yes gene_type:complete
MKIAFDTLGENPNQPSSAINYLIEFVRFFKNEENAEILLFVSNKNRHFFSEADNIKLVNCFFSNENIILRILSQQILIPLYLLYYNADLIYSPLNSAPLFTNKPVFLKINTLFQYEMQDHGNENLYNRLVNILRVNYRKIFFYLSAKKSRIIFANSNYTKNKIIQHYKKESNKIIILPEAPYEKFGIYSKDKSKKYVSKKFNINFKYFIYPANMYSYKNHFGSIKIYKKFLDKYKKNEIRLLFVGRDEDNIKNDLIKLANDLNIDKSVHFIDYVDIDDVVHLMNNSKALFFPSMNETFGKPLVEAMMSSVPASASNIEALSELAVDNKLLSDPNDIENFADKLHDALNVGSSYLARAKSKAENFTYKNHFKNIFSTFLEEIK